MENRKVLLVIDWSNIMYRSLFMHQLYNKNGCTYDRKEDMQSFIYKFAVDACSIINMFKPNKVILATDGQKSWRKNILDTYKSNRVKNENINWENIYTCSNDLQKIMQNAGIDVCYVDHGEADDIMAMCKENVFEKYNDYNIIIVSADADIRQLIDFNKDNKQYCVVYNTTGRGVGSKRRMYATQSFIDWVNTEETCDIFFDGVDDNKHYIKDLLSANPIIDLTVDNPDDVVLSKILCGDDGDDVPAFYGYYNNGKWVRITPSKSKKILSLTNTTTINEFLNVPADKLKSVFETVCKREICDIDFAERLKRQRTLVELASDNFPDDIRDYKETVSYILANSQNKSFVNMQAADLFKGTEYETANKRKALDAEVLIELNKLIN